MIEVNAHIILCILTALALLITAFCYYKSGNILKQSLIATADDTQDLLDKKYDFWGTFGVASSNILLGTTFIVFAFPFSDILSIGLNKIWQLIVTFFLHLLYDGNLISNANEEKRSYKVRRCNEFQIPEQIS